MVRTDQNRKWFYGKNARMRALKEKKMREKSSGNKYMVEKTLAGGYWLGTKKQLRKMTW